MPAENWRGWLGTFLTADFARLAQIFFGLGLLAGDALAEFIPKRAPCGEETSEGVASATFPHIRKPSVSRVKTHASASTGIRRQPNSQKICVNL